MKKIKIFVFNLIVILIISISTEGIAMNVPEAWVFSVVYIANLSTGLSGTGFLVSRRVNKDNSKVFLISNKHVLEPKKIEESSKENKEAKARVVLNKFEGEKISKLTIEVVLKDNNGNEYLRRHPNKDVDVAAIEFTPYIVENRTLRPDLKIGFIPEDKFATKEKLEEEFVSVGDKVIVLGYPLNLVEGGHSIPIARGGVIASYPNYDFRNLPCILIDATMVRGSSGSPVFLPFLPYKFQSKEKISQLAITQSSLLGIISKLVPDWTMEIKKTTVFGLEPETISVVDVANIGILFKAETIIDTINEFGYPTWQPLTEENTQEENKQSK
jgi:hypothetical protein